MRLYGNLYWRLHLEFTLVNDNISIHAQHLRPPMATLQDTQSALIALLWLHCARQRSTLPERYCIVRP